MKDSWRDADGCRFRTLYNFDRKLASVHSGLACEEGSSLAKQEYKDECDINTIAKNFGIGAELPVGVRMPTYDDFSQVVDFKSAMDSIARSRESFDAMPAHIRARFGHDPHQFVAFCSDRNNLQEAISLGLVPTPKVAPVKAPEPVLSNPQGSPAPTNPTGG